MRLGKSWMDLDATGHCVLENQDDSDLIIDPAA